VPALGLIPGKVIRFPDPPEDPAYERPKVPHMGWNQVRQSGAHPIWKGVPDDAWFYFVHSYHAAPTDPGHVIGSAEYTHEFPAAIAQHNVVAFQFHPEKSQSVGLQLLENFVQWDP
jgi:imidazole glycerol-phosphate synthase subunit HisH